MDMKLKSIILGIGLLAAMFSCSMEDNIIENAGGYVENTSEETYATLQFNISAGTELGTKTTTNVSDPTTGSAADVKNEEMTVNECFVFVANGDKIIGRRQYTKDDITLLDDGSYTLNKNILIKVTKDNQPELTVFAVGMKSDTDNTFEKNVFLGTATSLSQLKQSTINNPLTDFVKVGEGTIKPYSEDKDNGYQISEKTTNFTEQGDTIQCGKANIVLTLRAAAIEIASFMIRNSRQDILFDSETADISSIGNTIKDIQLGSMDKGGQIVNTMLNEGEASSKVRNYSSFKSQEEISNPIGYRFYTYQNTGEATRITIPYVNADGKDASINFSVKTSMTEETVLANHLYRINVVITNNIADVKVQSYTMDWKEGGSYEITLKPSTAY